jgi:hypothetical protein
VVNLRLPENIVPERYDVTLRPDLYSADPGKFSFTGSVVITLTVAKATSTVTLHHRQLTIDDATVEIKVGSRNIEVRSLIDQ